MFKIEGTKGYIAPRPEDPNGKPEWDQICWFLAISQGYKYKGQAFPGVRRIVFDECILPRGVGARYLPNEVDDLLNLFSTIAREKPGEPTRCRLYLMGNALDLNNPYFSRWCRKVPEVGTQWLFKDTNASVLLHYSDDKAFQSAMEETVVGQLMKGTLEGARAMQNKFTEADSRFVSKRSRQAKFRYGIKFGGSTFGFWWDWNAAIVYVTPDVPEGTSKDIYTCVAEDSTVDTIMVSRSSKEAKSVAKLFYQDCVRFEDPMTMSRFFRLCEWLGVH